MAFSKHGKFWFAHDSWLDYEKVEWDSINFSSRRKIIKHLMPKPAVCPGCGKPSSVDEYGRERVLILCNISRRFRRNLDDWYWTCRDCKRRAHREKCKKSRCKTGAKRKPWSELTHQSKMFRVRKVLPMPDACPYCDSTTVELVSRSGKWLEDPGDYVWCCRKHGRVLTQLATYHNAKTPWLRDRERRQLVKMLYELFPHWTNSNSMAGSFQGHSILNKNSAGGRFYTISSDFFDNWLR